jgi:hypothetical protein
MRVNFSPHRRGGCGGEAAALPGLERTLLKLAPLLELLLWLVCLLLRLRVGITGWSGPKR